MAMLEDENLDVLRAWRVRDNTKLILKTQKAVQKKQKELSKMTEQLKSYTKSRKRLQFSGAAGDSEEFLTAKSMDKNVSLLNRHSQAIEETANELNMLRKKLFILVKQTDADLNILFPKNELHSQPVGKNEQDVYASSSNSVSGVGEFHDVEDSRNSKKPGIMSKFMSFLRRSFKSKERNCDKRPSCYVDKLPGIDSFVSQPVDDALYFMEGDHVTSDRVKAFQKCTTK